MEAEQCVSEETEDDEERCVQRDYDLVFEWSCVKPGVGLDGPRGRLPTQDVLRFCKVWDSFTVRFQSLALPIFCPALQLVLLLTVPQFWYCEQRRQSTKCP